MNKFLILMTVFGVMIMSVGGVFAFDTSTSLSTTGDASATLSTEHETSSTQSARLWAANPSDPNEGRVRIEFNEVVTLSDITSISWEQYVDMGYIAHVDVKIDVDGNGIEDDALVFEYAKLKGTGVDCDDVGDYPLSVQINTFGDKGIVDDDAWAWLSSGPAGGCATPATTFFWHTLEDWKLGPPPGEANEKTINGDTRVIALEIEVDGWILESKAFIDDVLLNGDLIEDFEGTQNGEGEITPDFTFIPNPNPLNFGSLFPGQSSEVTSTLSVGVSDLTVTAVGVTNTTGNVFTTDNVLFSSNGGTTFENIAAFIPVDIPATTSADLIVQLNVPTGTTSGEFSGFITYTVMETL